MNGNQQQATASLVAVSRPEFIGDIPFVADQEGATLNTNNGVIPSDNFYYGVLLEVLGRVDKTNGAGTFTPNIDSVLNLIREIRFEGFHRIRKQSEQFYQVSGPDAFYLALNYSQHMPSIQFAGVALSADGDTDFRYFLPIVFPPEAVSLAQQGAYLLDAPNYDRLRMEIDFGAVGDVGVDAGGAATVLRAFGSAGATQPRVRVHGIFAQFGRDGAPGFVPGRVWRFTQVNNDEVRTTQNNARLFNINRGHLIRSLFLRMGTLEPVRNFAFTRENMDVLDDIRLMRGTNKQIRHYTDQWTLKEYDQWTKSLNVHSQELNRTLISGPATDAGVFAFEKAVPIAADFIRSASAIDFCENHDLGTILDTTKLVQGPTGDVDLFLQADVISGAANQQLRMVTQEIRGVPVGLRV